MEGRRDTKDPARPIILKRDDVTNSAVGGLLICTRFLRDAQDFERPFSVGLVNPISTRVVEDDPFSLLNLTGKFLSSGTASSYASARRQEQPNDA